MNGLLPLFVGLVTLLIGLAVGKAWERYKLREGRWIDRRKNRESPHYMQGLNFLVTNQLDLAIEEMGQAAALAPDALEIHMILGNLYREKGQVSRAVVTQPRCQFQPMKLCFSSTSKRQDAVPSAFNVT